jgi:acetyltransferase-like isoleucine patch superfamily enzyme
LIRLLSLLAGWWVYKPYSFLIRIVLLSKGIKVGKNFYIQGVPFLKIRGPSSNIKIGNNVSIHGNIDIRNRENGSIIIEDNVSFDTECRLVSANNAVLLFKKGSDIGGYNIFNCGTDVTIGHDTMIAGFCYIQSSNHGTAKGLSIKSQPHSYGEIFIGNDCWIASHVTVVPGVTIADGAIVGANAVVTKDLKPNTMNAGIPAKIIGVREDQ